MNRKIWTGIVMALATAAPIVLAQSIGAASPCPYGMTLTYSNITGTPKCIGTPINTYQGYLASQVSTNPTLAYMRGSTTLSESQWNAQAAQSASDQARGITFGGGTASTQIPSNTSAQGYDVISGQNELPQEQLGFISNLPASTGAQSGDGTYQGYLASQVSTNPTLAYMRGSTTLSESQWNAQAAQSASDQARGITFGGGAASGVQGVPVGSFCAPWGQTVTWDYTGAQTDTGAPCQ